MQALLRGFCSGYLRRKLLCEPRPTILGCLRKINRGLCRYGSMTAHYLLGVPLGKCCPLAGKLNQEKLVPKRGGAVHNKQPQKNHSFPLVRKCQP
jgi:hypothetical protein